MPTTLDIAGPSSSRPYTKPSMINYIGHQLARTWSRQSNPSPLRRPWAVQRAAHAWSDCWNRQQSHSMLCSTAEPPKSARACKQQPVPQPSIHLGCCTNKHPTHKHITWSIRRISVAVHTRAQTTTTHSRLSLATATVSVGNTTARSTEHCRTAPIAANTHACGDAHCNRRCNRHTEKHLSSIAFEHRQVSQY